MPRVRYSVSATTRAPRPGERDTIDYHFLSRERFEEWMGESKFLETREYNGNFYGTPLPFLEQTLSEGYAVVLKPEVNGALAIKAAYPDATLIFLLPDKFSQLQSRLEARRTETTPRDRRSYGDRARRSSKSCATSTTWLSTRTATRPMRSRTSSRSSAPNATVSTATPTLSLG